MLYVARDSEGAISEIHPEATAEAREAVTAENPEVLAFIHDRSREKQFSDLDRDFVRVIEDTIELLIAKDVILFTDLPASVQQKFMKRREVRQSLQFTNTYPDSDNDIIPI